MFQRQVASEHAVVPVEPSPPAPELALVPIVSAENPQPANFELPAKPLTAQHQAALTARLGQAASQVVARKGMAGAWKPGPGRPVADSPTHMTPHQTEI